MDMARRVNQGKGCITLVGHGLTPECGTENSGGDRHAGQSAAPVQTTMMVVEAVRKTMWTDESLNEIADELDKIKLTGTRGTERVQEKSDFCACASQGQGSCRKIKGNI